MNAIVQKKRKWRGWKTNIETFLKAFSLQNWQHLFKFTAFFMFDFLVVVLSACSGALLDSMLKRYEPILPHSRPPPPPPSFTGPLPIIQLFVILDLFYFRYFSLSMTFTYFSAIYPGGHRLLHHTNYTRVYEGTQWRYSFRTKWINFYGDLVLSTELIA